MAKDRRVVEHGYPAVGRLGVGRPHVIVVLQVVLGVEDRRVVDPARLCDGVLQGGAAAGVAPLALAPLHVVVVVAGKVRPVRKPQVAVLVVVALDVEGLVAAAPLAHAESDEVLQSLIFIIVRPFSNVGIFI